MSDTNTMNTNDTEKSTDDLDTAGVNIAEQGGSPDGYPEKRKLCGLYFHTRRDGKWGPVCFTDMTETEQNLVISNRSEEWLQSLVLSLAGTIRKLGDQFDIVAGHPEDHLEEDEEKCRQQRRN